MNAFYKSESEILAVVRGFEECTTRKEEFTHQSHLTVATSYLLDSTPDQAHRRMCSGLLGFLNHHGVDKAKYNEALTWAWIQKIQLVIDATPSNYSIVAITNLVIEQLAGQRIKPQPVSISNE
jgi:hypothetical protein